MQTESDSPLPSTARLFWNGKSQAVRLPKAFRFDDTEVIIRRRGKDVILSPKPKRRVKSASEWDALFASLPDLEDDFMKERPLNQISKPRDIF